MAHQGHGRRAPAQIDEVVRVDTVQFGNRGSGGYTIAEHYDLTLYVEKALETSGAVVGTSATSTMDEIVYWLELTAHVGSGNSDRWIPESWLSTAE